MLTCMFSFCLGLLKVTEIVLNILLNVILDILNLYNQHLLSSTVGKLP